MKSQFVKINALQGKGSQSEQSPNGWSQADTRSTVPFDQLHGGQTSFGQTPQSPGAGLPSNWDARSLPSPHPNGTPGQISIAEQNTLKQQAMNGPITGPTRNGNNAQVQMLAYGQMPMSYQGAGGFPPPGYAPHPGMGNQGNNRKKRRFPIWARIAVSIFLLLLVVVGGLAGYYYYNFSAPVSHIVGQQVTRLKGDEDPNAVRNGADILSGPRINILLLGSDTDQKFTNTDGSHNYLAQSDIVVTIDPATKSVGMLSIPRDFWIRIGNGMHKLDEAYSLGGPAIGSGAYSPGGVALSRLTVFQDFGIPINYYAWVGLDGFVKVIDTVGGVDVDVLHRDFSRSARQQQVLSALKTKLNNPDIVSKLPEIASDLNGYVKTDMQLTDVFKLMNFARSLNANSINRVILGPPYSADGTTPDGQAVVFPDCGKIVPVIAQMFALGNRAACNIQANSSNNALASATQPSSASNDSATNHSLQAASQVASTSAMNLGGGSDNPSGFHSLLDLMFMVVLESPQAMQA